MINDINVIDYQVFLQDTTEQSCLQQATLLVNNHQLYPNNDGEFEIVYCNVLGVPHLEIAPIWAVEERIKRMERHGYKNITQGPRLGFKQGDYDFNDYYFDSYRIFEISEYLDVGTRMDLEERARIRTTVIGKIPNKDNYGSGLKRCFGYVDVAAYAGLILLIQSWLMRLYYWLSGLIKYRNIENGFRKYRENLANIMSTSKGLTIVSTKCLEKCSVSISNLKLRVDCLNPSHVVKISMSKGRPHASFMKIGSTHEKLFDMMNRENYIFMGFSRNGSKEIPIHYLSTGVGRRLLLATMPGLSLTSNITTLIEREGFKVQRNMTSIDRSVRGFNGLETMSLYSFLGKWKVDESGRKYTPTNRNSMIINYEGHYISLNRYMGVWRAVGCLNIDEWPPEVEDVSVVFEKAKFCQIVGSMYNITILWKGDALLFLGECPNNIKNRCTRFANNFAEMKKYPKVKNRRVNEGRNYPIDWEKVKNKIEEYDRTFEEVEPTDNHLRKDIDSAFEYYEELSTEEVVDYKSGFLNYKARMLAKKADQSRRGIKYADSDEIFEVAVRNPSKLNAEKAQMRDVLDRHASSDKSLDKMLKRFRKDAKMGIVNIGIASRLRSRYLALKKYIRTNGILSSLNNDVGPKLATLIWNHYIDIKLNKDNKPISEDLIEQLSISVCCLTSIFNNQARTRGIKNSQKGSSKIFSLKGGFCRNLHKHVLSLM